MIRGATGTSLGSRLQELEGGIGALLAWSHVGGPNAGEALHAIGRLEHGLQRAESHLGFLRRCGEDQWPVVVGRLDRLVTDLERDFSHAMARLPAVPQQKGPGEARISTRTGERTS